MGHKQLSAEDAGDVIWVCRHLAAALQRETTILPALDSLLLATRSGRKELVAAMRQGLIGEANVARGLVPLGLPSFIWGTILSGELRGDAASGLTRVADRLEIERAAGLVRDKRLYAYSLALGRLGVMLQEWVPILSALEAAADSVSSPEVRDAMLAARDAVREGVDLSQALSRIAAGLPPAAIDMIRDAEQAGRLAEALAVVSDYLQDEAGGSTAPKGKEKH
jgi:type II secretory pathway component PulF